MRVLMLAPLPFFEPRGSCYQVLHRIETLASLGHEIDLLAYHIGASPEVKGLRIHRIPKVPGIRRVKVGPSWPKLILDLLLFMSAIRLLWRGEYDLIHAHEETSFMGGVLARLFGPKLVYEMHSSLPQQLDNFDFYAVKPVVRLFERLERWALSRADGVITICLDLRDHATRIRPDVPHALLENVGDAAPQYQRSHNGLATTIAERFDLEGRRVILYTGTFERYQGLELLVDTLPEIARRFPDALVLLVGGRPDQIDELGERARRLGVRDHVTFAGTVPQDEISAYLDVADVLVSPRMYGTNTPLKIYAYLRSGKPIVATNLWTHTQVLTPEVAELTEATSEAFTEGLCRVLDDRAYARQLARAAEKLARERYSYEHFVQETKRLYDVLDDEGSAGKRQPNNHNGANRAERGASAPPTFSESRSFASDYDQLLSIRRARDE